MRVTQVAILSGKNGASCMAIQNCLFLIFHVGILASMLTIQQINVNLEDIYAAARTSAITIECAVFSTQ